MDFLELAKSRYSVRKFSTNRIVEEKLSLILEAGRVAPTAVNRQPQRILVLENEEDLAKLKPCIPYRFQETLALLVCYDKNESWKRSFDNKDSGEVDASIVATHMMLEAYNLGIGSTWVGHFDPQVTREMFQIPQNIEPVVLLLLGYPSHESSPNPNHYKRLDRAQTVYYGSFPEVEK
ncbi:nitroreductase [Desulfitobacterium dehalogenans ATCC 51507]|uniref:Nitroreductase n=1 Tax=Desulfitobacterium dehalogenans (strain ATCC 51507 / DSM 9161 / JW/IU-DC1) TaxID=756499 RepID=I4A7L2_DESDJ|nr:nitroreductase family protein [Desulfitobacterium dehalogenans]AFL99946.1 nitroreductase [Desulfitobacterium dehalogenans ATCC 51507]